MPTRQVWLPVVQQSFPEIGIPVAFGPPYLAGTRRLSVVSLPRDRMAGPDFGRVPVTWCLCEIDEADWSKYQTIARAEAAVPERDRLIVRLDCQGHLKRLTPEAEARLDAFFNAIPNMATAARKEMAAWLLEQARARGLSAQKALEIAERLGLDINLEALRPPQTDGKESKP